MNKIRKKNQICAGSVYLGLGEDNIYLAIKWNAYLQFNAPLPMEIPIARNIHDSW